MWGSCREWTGPDDPWCPFKPGILGFYDWFLTQYPHTFTIVDVILDTHILERVIQRTHTRLHKKSRHPLWDCHGENLFLHWGAKVIMTTYKTCRQTSMETAAFLYMPGTRGHSSRKPWKEAGDAWRTAATVPFNERISVELLTRKVQWMTVLTHPKNVALWLQFWSYGIKTRKITTKVESWSQQEGIVFKRQLS